MKYALLLGAALSLLALAACHLPEVEPPPTCPTADFTASGGGCPTFPCEVTFTSLAEGATMRIWDFGDGKTDTGAVVRHIYTAANVYNVKLTVSAAGCPASEKTLPVNVGVIVDGPEAMFTVVNNNCEAPTSVTFTNTSLRFDQVLWDFGDSTTSMASGTVSHPYMLAGDYTVRLIAIKDALRDTITQTVTICAIKFDTTRADLGPAVRVYQMPDRGYAVVGNTITSNKSQPYLLLLDERGEQKQVPKHYPLNNDASVADFVPLKEGGFVLVGRTNRNVPNSSQTTEDMFYLWLDDAGNLKTPAFPLPADSVTSNTMHEFATSVMQTADGQVLITGYKSSPVTGSKQAYVFKSNLSLSSIDINGPISLPGFVEAIDAVEVPGGFIIVGNSRADLSSLPDIFLQKIDRFGTPQSASPEKYGGDSSSELPSSVAKAPDGTLMVYGRSNSTGNNDFYLVKTDANGKATAGFPKPVPDALSRPEVSKEIRLMQTGGFVAVGLQNNSAYFFTTDVNGNLGNPMKLFGAVEGFNSGQQTTDGGFVLAGYRDNFKFYLAKTDPKGNTQ